MKKIYIRLIFATIIIVLCNISLGNSNNNSQHLNNNLIYNLTSSNFYFVGREESLLNIKKTFSNDEKFVSIVGSPAIGKSQLVKKYADINKKNYDVIWWFDCKGDLYDQYNQLGMKLKETINDFPNNFDLLEKNLQINVIKDYLYNSEIKWLMIYDDIDLEKEYLLKFMANLNENKFGNIITTSRKTNAKGKVMKLEKFTREESIELITKILESATKESANILAEMLADHPLAIAISSSYIKLHPSLDIDNYKSIYLKYRDELVKNENELVQDSAHEIIALNNYNKPLSQVLNISLKEIKNQNKLSFDIISLFSLLYHNNIPYCLAKKYALEVQKVSELEFEKAISLLINYSLISFTKYENKVENNIKLFSIHETIQMAIKDIMSQSDKIEYLEYNTLLLNSFLPSKIDKLVNIVSTDPYWGYHQESIIKQGNDLIPLDPNLIDLMIKDLEKAIWWLDYDRGHKLIATLDQTIPELEHNSTTYKRLRAKYYLYKANFYDLEYQDQNLILGLYHQAIILFENDENYCNELYTVHALLSQSYGMHGDVNNAFEEIIKSKEIIEKNGDKISNQGLFYHIIAWLYMEKGQYLEALKYIETGIKIEEILPFDTSSIANYLLKSEILIKQGNYQNARDLIHSLYDKTLKILPKNTNHELFSRILTLLAKAENSLGNIKDAEFYIKQSEKIINEFYGVDKYNADISLSMLVKADILFSKKLYSEAFNQYKVAENSYKKSFAKQEIEYVSDIYSNIIKTSVLLNDAYSVNYYYDLFKENYGLENKKLKELIHFLLKNNIKIEL
jgi:hypothetical protein